MITQGKEADTNTHFVDIGLHHLFTPNIEGRRDRGVWAAQRRDESRDQLSVSASAFDRGLAPKRQGQERCRPAAGGRSPSG